MTKRTAFDDFKDATSSLIGRLYQDKKVGLGEDRVAYVFTGIGKNFYNGQDVEDCLWFYNLTFQDSRIPSNNIEAFKSMEMTGILESIDYFDLTHDEAEVLAYWEQARIKEFQLVNS